MICCIDANIFIWGVKRRCDPGQEDMLERAIHLFDWLDNNDHKIMMPTVVIAEVLAPEPLEKHAVYLNEIFKSFMVVDFDIRAASQFGVLFMNRIEELKKLAGQIDVDNQKMKTDHLIIASAVANGANCIYSHDKGIKAFGQRVIDVKDLPQLPAKPLTLFDKDTPF